MNIGGYLRQIFKKKPEHLLEGELDYDEPAYAFKYDVSQLRSDFRRAEKRIQKDVDYDSSRIDKIELKVSEIEERIQKDHDDTIRQLYESQIACLQQKIAFLRTRNTDKILDAPSTKDRIMQYLSYFPDASNKEIARFLDVGVGTISRYRKDIAQSEIGLQDTHRETDYYRCHRELIDYLRLDNNDDSLMAEDKEEPAKGDTDNAKK